MRKFLPENGRITRTSDQSHFGSPSPVSGLVTARLVWRAFSSTISGSGSSDRLRRQFLGKSFFFYIYRTGRVEGRVVTASSRGVSGRHSTSDISFTPAPFGPGLYYDPGAPGASIPVDSSYSGADYRATDCSNPSSDAGLGRDSGTSGDSDMTRSEEPVMDDEDEPEDDGGGDDDGNGHNDDDEPVPVAHASSSGCRPASGKGKGLTGSFISVMSKITRSRQKRPEKPRPPTNPT
ncbi:hypothetical protein M9H77_14346 [Catharanthus roseus]|uniref:Uncharacterized protein n=1 Tax=Catharanthus roseus TaxID=4058 RepID=A0ACC0BMZ8_CATRO|nr:hypothetical protein M9H77_14346 [Catharanthus roseus]